MAICHGCGRYVKELVARPGMGVEDIHPLVERILTQELSEAAERRGLRA
ncbi:MAG: hypothetical protein ACRENI_15110 [Gemmatimonadaceae bacterium]